MTKFNSSFIKSTPMQVGGTLKPTPPIAAPKAAPYSPELGQKFTNGSDRYQTTFNDPAAKYSVIKNQRGEEIHIPYNKLQRLINNKTGSMDLSALRRFKGGEGSYYQRNTKGGQRYYAPGQKEAMDTRNANRAWDTESKARRTPGAYHANGREAMVLDRGVASQPGAAKTLPINTAYRKGGVLVEPSSAKTAVLDLKKSGKKPKLVAKKEKCGGKMSKRKMTGGKMKKAGDCGCNK